MLNKTYPEKIRSELQLLIDHLNSTDETVRDLDRTVTRLSVVFTALFGRFNQLNLSNISLSRMWARLCLSIVSELSSRCLWWDGSVGLLVNIDQQTRNATGDAASICFFWLISIFLSSFFGNIKLAENETRVVHRRPLSNEPALILSLGLLATSILIRSLSRKKKKRLCIRFKMWFTVRMTQSPLFFRKDFSMSIVSFTERTPPERTR